MHLCIRIQFIDARKQFLPRGLSGQSDVIGQYSQLLARLLLVADIDLGGGIVADDDDGEARVDTVLAQQNRPMLCTRLDAYGKFFAI